MKALFDYYPEHTVLSAGYRFVSFSVGDDLIRIPVVTPVDGFGLQVPLLAGNETLVDSPLPPPPPIDPDIVKQYSDRLLASGARLWDDDLFCITSFRSPNQTLHASIGTGRFLAYRLSVGLLRDELILAARNNDWSLPLRARIAPDVATLTDFSHRLAGGGVHTLCAFRRPAPDDDYLILLQQRSTLVSEARNSLGVVPMAFHQPPHQSCAPLDPRSPAATALREVFEEIFGGEEGTQFLHHPAIDWLLQHQSRIHLELTSFYISLVSGNYDFGTVLVVPDPDFWRAFSEQLQHSWESHHFLPVSSRDRVRLEEFLRSPNWEGQALGTFVEGLLRLRQIDAGRVASIPLARSEVS